MAISIALIATGAGNNSPAGSNPSFTYAVGAALSAKSYLRVNWFQSVVSNPVTVTDSKGNTWTQSSLGTALSYHECTVTNPLTATDTITITINNPSSSATDYLFEAFYITGITHNRGDLGLNGSSTLTYTWGPTTDPASFDTSSGLTIKNAIFVIIGQSLCQHPVFTSGPDYSTTTTFDGSHTALYADHSVRYGVTGGKSTASHSVGYRIYPSGGTHPIGNNESGSATCTISPSTDGNSLAAGQFLAFYDAGSPGYSGPWILAPRSGGTHLTYAKGGDIKYKTSPTPGVPTFGAEISVTGGTGDSEPRMADGHPQGRIKLVFTRGSDVYLTNSDGDGEAGTWSTPVALFTSAKHPTVCYDPTSRTWFFAAYSSGRLTGSIQGPGDSAPIAPFTLTDDLGAALAPDDDTFHVAPAAADSARRWELAFLKGGSVVVYQCTDDGSSWKQIV